MVRCGGAQLATNSSSRAKNPRLLSRGGAFKIGEHTLVDEEPNDCAPASPPSGWLKIEFIRVSPPRAHYDVLLNDLTSSMPAANRSSAAPARTA